MSSIGTGYDLAASTFSPDGRIFQVEYAEKAVDNNATVVSLGSKFGVVTAIEKVVVSKLYVEDDSPHVSTISNSIGLTGSGFYPDCRSLLNYAQEESSKYLQEYRLTIPAKKLADTIAEHMHVITLGISRPFGASLFLTAWDKYKGPSLYCIEPSGLNYQYSAWSIGKNRQAAKTEIEKLGNECNQLTLDQLLREAIRILITVRDEKQKNLMIEVGWVGVETNGEHRIVNAKLVEELEKNIKEALEAEDMD